MGGSSGTMSQWVHLREVQLLEQTGPMVLLSMDEALKIHLEDGTIDFERSNQIA